MKKISVDFCFLSLFSFLLYFLSFFFFPFPFFTLFYFYFWLKSKTKNVKRERSGVLRSVSNLKRRLREIVPNGSVYPWVSAQCRLTYFNYGLRVCCAPRRIHGLGLTGEPKLSGEGDYFWLCMLMGSSVLPAPGEPSHAFLLEADAARGCIGAGFLMPPDTL